jgi:hypothetical protein
MVERAGGGNVARPLGRQLMQRAVGGPAGNDGEAARPYAYAPLGESFGEREGC